MNIKNENCLFANISWPMPPKRWPIGELVVRFYDLPNARKMMDEFVSCGGRCSKKEFIERFHCPEWAFEFLVRCVDCGSLALAA